MQLPATVVLLACSLSFAERAVAKGYLQRGPREGKSLGKQRLWSDLRIVPRLLGTVR